MNHQPYDNSIKGIFKEDAEDLIPNFLEGARLTDVFDIEVLRPPMRANTEQRAANCRVFNRGGEVGLLHFATLSTGDTIENPRYLRTSEQKLAAKQQALSRKKRGSHRRRIAAQQVGKCHRHVRNQRQDFLHKVSRHLVDCYETIIFEGLKPKNMSRRPKPKQDAQTGTFLPNRAAAKGGLNKSIADAGWATFVTMVCAKAESAGHVSVLFVDPTRPVSYAADANEKGHTKTSVSAPIHVLTAASCSIAIITLPSPFSGSD